MCSIGQIKKELEFFLKANNIQEYIAYSREILEYAFDINYTALILQFNEKCPLKKEKIFDIARECLQKPIAYVLKQRYFFGRKFYVDENVLIPRFDTESVVEYCIDSVNKNNYKSILDLCCGSGCIGVSISLECNIDSVDFCDVSIKALEVAKKNAAQNLNSYSLIQGDLFNNIKRKYDLIISNPPYISSEEYNMLESSVKDFEPKIALLAQDEGLEFYKRIVKDAKNHLNPNGSLIFEIGATQAEQVIKLLKDEKFVNIEYGYDINNKPRFAGAKLV